MKKITVLIFFLCIMLVMPSCGTTMKDDTGSSADNSNSDNSGSEGSESENSESDNSESSGESMPGINDILPSATNDSDGGTDGTENDNGNDNNPPEGTTPAGSPDSSIRTGNLRGLSDTVAQVMERIEGIISVTQNYFKDSRGAGKNSSDRLSLAQARCSALADAHFSDDEVSFEREELVSEEDKEYFSLEFIGGGIKYYYKVDAYTGKIIDKNKEDVS